jgi:hypothetical protein
LLGYFFYVCATFAAVIMLLISLFNDSSALVRQIHYARPVVVRTVAMRESPLTSASVKREASWQKSNPFVPTGVSPVKETEKAVVSTTKSEQRLKTLARQSDKPKERYYATALSQAYDFTAR